MSHKQKTFDINDEACVMQFAFMKKGHRLRVREWNPGMGDYVKGAKVVGYAIVTFFEGEELVLASDRLHPTPEDAWEFWDISPAHADHVIGYVNFDVAVEKLAESIGFELMDVEARNGR